MPLRYFYEASMSVTSFLQKIMGDPTQKRVKSAQAVVEKIHALEESLRHLSDEQLQEKTQEFRERIQKGETTESILPEAFAVVKDACRRMKGHKFLVNKKEEEWNMVPYDVQLIGGILLHSGRIAEMKTGEGKTLVASLPAYLEALAGEGVHIITVNDYLASRDAQWMRPLYEFLGLSVGVIIHGVTQQERYDAYHSDITYGTNNEFGFDYLRDNMSTRPQDIVQRDLHFSIVDEVDSILIDEARTPLIISAPAEESTSKYTKYGRLVRSLQKDVHYVIDEKRKTAVLNEDGIKKMEELMGVDNIYTDAGFAEVHHIEQALKAIAVFQRDTDYVVKDGEVIIVDEFTGRLMPGRRFSDGLHQSLEAKEGVPIKRESRTLATVTFQNYFRMYKRLAGMTGTAKTEEEEFLKIYGLEVAVVPTNKEIVRKDLNDLVFKNERGKFQAVVKEVKQKHSHGQPVLIGTISIERSELLSALLKREGIPHEVLNAKNHAREAQIIANAGQRGAITIATNMAGRGTDIKLGEGVEEIGGLCIIGSERHESRRIDNQLRGRSGRQGDPGETRFFVSLEDSLMRLFGSDRLQKIMDTLKIPDDMPIENRMISSSIESAQKKVEGHHFDIRKHVVQYDDVMNKQREIIYKRRRKILEEEDIHEEFLKWIDAEVETLADLHIRGRQPHKYELKEFSNGISIFHKDESLSAENLERIEVEEKIISYAKTFLLDQFSEREKALPNKEHFREAERIVVLRIIDQFWMEHIDEMTCLREQVALVGYAQKNPLHEYQAQGFEKFTALLRKIQHQAIHTMFQMDITLRFGDEMPVQPMKTKTNVEDISRALTASDTVSRAGVHRVRASTSLGNSNVSFRPGNTQRIRVEDAAPKKSETGRNDPCPCGSGKKYKKCCG
jgi:preprotein translocase subunit SecA